MAANASSSIQEEATCSRAETSDLSDIDWASSTQSTVPTSSSESENILSRLRSPKDSEISRKRKIQLNPPPKGKRRSRGHGTFDPKSVTPLQRVKDFPEQNLCVSNKNYFVLHVERS